MVALFDPYRIKDVPFRNRISVSPMCQYSAEDGFVNDWHLVHLGSRAVGGAGLVVVEATAVSPEGRISPADTGIWSDAHVEPLSRIAKFLTEHGAVAGIQIAHAGRKASANRPWEGDDHLEPNEGAWEIFGPSPEAFGAHLPHQPKAMTKQDITSVQQHFVDAAKRALAAGFQLLEIHFAHGYLAHSFYSPLSNKRTDEYGGSFENRTRFLVETFDAVRAVWPERLPLIVRLSVTDWIPGGVTVEESIELATILKKRGLDLLDVSQGFVTPDISQVPWGPGFMIPIAGKIREAAKIPTSVGWMITEAGQADSVIREGQADLVMLAREMLHDAYWPYHAARALGVTNAQQILPIQYAYWLKNR